MLTMCYYSVSAGEPKLQMNFTCYVPSFPLLQQINTTYYTICYCYVSVESELQMISCSVISIFTKSTVRCLSRWRNRETVIRNLVEPPHVTSRFAWS